MVYKVKVNYLLEQLSPWNVKKHSDSDVSQMIEQLWECLQFVKVHARVNVLNHENCNQEMCTLIFYRLSGGLKHLHQFSYGNWGVWLLVFSWWIIISFIAQIEVIILY